MRMLTLARRNACEILRDPLNLAFGIGFPVILLLLLSAIQANVPVSLFEIGHLTPGVTVFGLAFMTLFSATIAVVVTLAISWVGLLIINSLLVLPAASARNVSRNLKQYCGFSVLFALVAGLGGLILSYVLGASAGAAICLILAVIFGVTFCLRKVRG